VTGASRGIGAAIARAFAESGERVAIHFGQRRYEAAEVAASLPGDGHIVVGADLIDAKAVERMVSEVADAFGRIDVLVNNAGVFTPHPIDQGTYEDWQQAWGYTVGVNLLGAANVTWCAVRHMHIGGRIVNVASRGAFRGEPDQPAYGASKAGLIAFGQSLALALGRRGIAVTSVAPGYVETEMSAKRLRDRSASVLSDSPLGRLATPQEVAAAVIYLASPDAEFASGAVLDLNGASHLRL
jgi:NAD(P)-dependent dehydrogenase (short-subunit alcohol dehydrogenase family)